MPVSFREPLHWAILLCASILGACGGSSSGPPAARGDIQLKTLSNRADLISDGDAYVEVLLPPAALVSDLRLDVDGKDVTASFAARANGRVLGVLKGFPGGVSTLNARLGTAGVGARLQIRNFDRSGLAWSLSRNAFETRSFILNLL